MRALFFILTLVLVSFAAVQYNDPDGWLWALTYLYAASVLFLTFLKRNTAWLAWLGASGFLTGFFYLMPTIQTNWIEIETAREAFGLLICAICMLLVNLYLRLQNREKNLE